MSHPLYIISGVSGSGKTTVGKALTHQLTYIRGIQHVFIDIDYFYLKDDRFVSWDCLDVIDPDMITEIKGVLEKSPVVLVGFALPKTLLSIPSVVHIHLVTAHNSEDLYERCVDAYTKAKPFMDKENLSLIVSEVVIPLYHQAVKNSDVSHLVDVFNDEGQRIPLDQIVENCLNIIHESSQVRVGHHTMDISHPYFDLIKSGRKPVEGRKISSTWKKVRMGDTMTITCSDQPSFDVQVTGVTMYLPSSGNPLEEYLRCETLHRALPGVHSIEDGKRVYLQWSTEEEIRKMGMMGIQVKVL